MQNGGTLYLYSGQGKGKMVSIPLRDSRFRAEPTQAPEDGDAKIYIEEGN